MVIASTTGNVEQLLLSDFMTQLLSLLVMLVGETEELRRGEQITLSGLWLRRLTMERAQQCEGDSPTGRGVGPQLRNADSPRAGGNGRSTLEVPQRKLRRRAAGKRCHKRYQGSSFERERFRFVVGRLAHVGRRKCHRQTQQQKREKEEGGARNTHTRTLSPFAYSLVRGHNARGKSKRKMKASAELGSGAWQPMGAS